MNKTDCCNINMFYFLYLSLRSTLLLHVSWTFVCCEMFFIQAIVMVYGLSLLKSYKTPSNYFIVEQEIKFWDQLLQEWQILNCNTFYVYWYVWSLWVLSHHLDSYRFVSFLIYHKKLSLYLNKYITWHISYLCMFESIS